MKAIRFSVVSIVVALFSPLVAGATIFTDNYVAPVVARGNGNGARHPLMTLDWDAGSASGQGMRERS